MAAPSRSSASRPVPAPARTRPAAYRGRAAYKGKLVFERRNYVLLLASLALIVAGYVLMAVENEIDGFLSLYVAPILLMAGYLLVGYAVLWQPRRPAAGAVTLPEQS